MFFHIVMYVKTVELQCTDKGSQYSAVQCTGQPIVQHSAVQRFAVHRTANSEARCIAVQCTGQHSCRLCSTLAST